MSTVRTRIIWACVGSLLLHALILFLIFLPQPAQLRGSSGETNGSVAQGGKAMEPIDLTFVRAMAVGHSAVPASATTPQADAMGSQASAVNEMVTDAGAVAPSSAAKADAEEDGKEAPSAAAAAPAAANAAPGITDGDRTILQQIARCFPPGAHPSLANVKLDIQLDAKGNLAAVPVVELDLAKSQPTDIRAANTIVQATMQCGPYVLPSTPATLIQVAADFADVRN